ncbi:MAG: hypothetical protein V3W04_01265 [Gammaproteobacteria bacterium]
MSNFLRTLSFFMLFSATAQAKVIDFSALNIGQTRSCSATNFSQCQLFDLTGDTIINEARTEVFDDEYRFSITQPVNLEVSIHTHNTFRNTGPFFDHWSLQTQSETPLIITSNDWTLVTDRGIRPDDPYNAWHIANILLDTGSYALFTRGETDLTRGHGIYEVTISTSSVPLPSSVVLLGSVLLGISLISRAHAVRIRTKQLEVPLTKFDIINE